MLWGYPDLFKVLYGDIRSALVEERGKRRETEKEEQQDSTVEHLNNVPEVMEENIDNTTSAPAPFSPRDDGSGPFVMAQKDAQPGSKTRPIDRPSASDEHLSSATIATKEAFESTSGSLIPRPDTGETVTSPIEIKDVLGPSTPDDNKEELRVA